MTPCDPKPPVDINRAGWETARPMQIHFHHHRFVRLAVSLLLLPFMAAIVDSQGRGGGDGARAPMANGAQNPLLSVVRFRSIGPASMGARIDDIAVSESDPNVIYVG